MSSGGCSLEEPKHKPTCHLVIYTANDEGWQIMWEDKSETGIGSVRLISGLTGDKTIRQEEIEYMQSRMSNGDTFMTITPVNNGSVGYVGFNFKSPQIVATIKAKKDVVINGARQVDPILLKPGVHGFQIISSDAHVIVKHVECPVSTKNSIRGEITRE